MFHKDDHPLEKLSFLTQRENWRTESIYLDDFRLEIAGHPVMESWEDPYMKKLAEIATGNGGKVLEVGFGMGIAASYIQEYSISEHHIIEANNEVFRQLQHFAGSSKVNVISYLGFWEDITQQFEDEYFDGILFDTYPIIIEELYTARFSFFSEAFRLLKPGGVFTHYSGELTFTDEYTALLKAANFRNFSSELISVKPPHDCLYWNEPYLMAPKILKDN
ncbi:methyltransferase domain-containing protein [Limnothrix redekei]|uniref:Methyltransferase domain-containing protein n=1 Tax=Limnothrix redekei LRLZ20PSL1 TaxID=3112953 RepID=A0ABW7CDJ4_9CYAN